MISEEQIEKALDFMRDNAAALGTAKGERVYLEQFRKSKKAILMAEGKAKDPKMRVADLETYAYAHPDYLALLLSLRDAVEEEERLKWLMTAADAKVEVWRTQEATARTIDRGHR